MLRGEIVRAARTLLERTGSEDSVSLRSVAREAGITAPAIYDHFPDRAAVLQSAITDAFQEFDTAIRSAMRGHTDAVSRLEQGCWAYIQYAHAHPATYGTLFTRFQPSEAPDAADGAAALFQVLITTYVECGSESADPAMDAVLLWAGVHGLASLPPHHPRFPWPDHRQLLARLLRVHLDRQTVPVRPIAGQVTNMAGAFMKVELAARSRPREEGDPDGVGET